MSNILRSAIQYKGPVSENLVEFIKVGLRKHADKVIIIDSASDRRWTGAQLECKIFGVANYLRQECKLKRGDICTIYGEPNDHFVILMLAVMSAGGVSNYFTNNFRPREIVDSSKFLNSNFFIGTKELLEKLKDHVDSSDVRQTKILSVDKKYGDSYGPIGHLLDQSSGQVDQSVNSILAQLASETDPSDLAVVQFSSGTTGKPKPIPRTHKNLCHLVASVDHEELMNLRPGQVIAGSLPITHRPGLWALLACINGGSTFVLWDKLSDIEGALQLIEKHRVTILSASLTFLAELGNTGILLKDKFNLKSLEQIITSGAKIVHAELPTSIVKEFQLDTLRQCFGMTESGWVFLLESSLARSGNYLTVGHVVPGSEVAIIDRDTKRPVGEGTRGELAVRGPQVFPGYLTGPAGCTSSLNRGDFLEDGWFRTGDQAYYDAQGLVFIEGRYKELVIFPNGGRFFPNDIEAVLSEHPAVESSCVVNIGQTGSFDVARGFVTLRQGYQVTEKGLLDFVSDRSYEIMLQGGIKMLDKFPRLQNGKVNKSLLKEMKFDD